MPGNYWSLNCSNEISTVTNGSYVGTFCIIFFYLLSADQKSCTLVPHRFWVVLRNLLHLLLSITFQPWLHPYKRRVFVMPIVLFFETLPMLTQSPPDAISVLAQRFVRPSFHGCPTLLSMPLQSLVNPGWNLPWLPVCSIVTVIMQPTVVPQYPIETRAVPSSF